MINAVKLEETPVAAFDVDSRRYAKCMEASARIRWDIDRDVIRGRDLDFSKKFLPEGLSKVSELEFLGSDEQKLLSQIQGRTYANFFAAVERFIGAKMMEVGRGHALGDQTALEALVRFTEEELKHQELFRRVERMAATGMPAGYQFLPDANEVAGLVLGKSTWSVLALTCMIELFTQVHYRESIGDDAGVCPVWKDVYLHHWKEESQHAILDELEWMRENARLTAAQRDAAVDDLVALVGAVDGMLQVQARADADYFIASCGRRFGLTEPRELHQGFLTAYRQQYIVSGVKVARFGEILGGMLTPAQNARVGDALKPILEAAG